MIITIIQKKTLRPLFMDGVQLSQWSLTVGDGALHSQYQETV